MTEKYTCVGKVTRPHGIRGEVCVEWYAEDSDLLEGELYLEDRELRAVSPLSWRPHKGGLLMTLEGVENRDQAQALSGLRLVVPVDSLPALPENEAYLADLLGCEAVLPDGASIGRLHHFEYPPGGVVWALRDGEWETLFPCRSEFIVSLGDPIVLDPPEGLLEVCRTPLKK